jgi:LuxR family maltose regulon positive regulatory protein
VRSTVLIPLVNILEDLGARLTVVLDDLHAITDVEALASFDWFLGHLPRGLRLIISTHAEPELAAVRTLRAAGDMLEFRSAELALRPDETREFLTARFGSNVHPEDIDELERRIDGWPAALCLVSLALQRGDTPAEVLSRLESGDALAHDLAEGVLRTQTPEVQSFLLRTSVFERFSAELCEQVLDDPEAVRVLRKLAASSLLVVPLDHRHSWFRYHPLLRDLLRAQLESSDRETWRSLHLRAGRWFEQRDDVRVAMVHYLSGGHWEETAALLGARYGDVGPLSGRVRAWLGAIPEHIKQDDARLCYVAALHAAATGDRGGMELWLRRGAAAAWDGPLPDGAPSFEAAELMLRTLFSYDDLGSAAASAERASELETEPSSAWTVQDAQASVTLYGLGRFEEAEAHAARSQERGLRDPWLSATMWSAAVRALIALRRGDRGAARPLIAAAVAARDALGVSASPHSFLVLCAQARYLTDTGRASEAVELCEQALDLGPEALVIASSAIVFVPSAMLELARARRAVGDLDGARAALEQAREMVGDATDAGAIPAWIDELEEAIAGDESPPPGAPKVADAVPIGVQQPRNPTDLSQRELQILRLLSGTMSQREIASELFISHNTIKTHLRTLYRKLDVSSREEAVDRARQAGLLRRSISAGRD